MVFKTILFVFKKTILMNSLILKGLLCNDGSSLSSTTRVYGSLTTNINIGECFFTRITEYSGNGGVLFISTANTIMNLNSSTFYDCHATNGGCIYFSCLTSKSYLNLICVSDCSTISGANDHHFAYIDSGIGSNYENNLYFISINRCSSLTNHGRNPITLFKSTQIIKNVNISNNGVSDTSGIYSSNSNQLFISHSNFANNYASGHISIRIHSSSVNSTINYIKVVNNSSPTYGVIYFNSVTSIISKSVFNQNTLKLFAFEGSNSLIFQNCMIFHHASHYATLSVFVFPSNNIKASIDGDFHLLMKLDLLNSYLCRIE